MNENDEPEFAMEVGKDGKGLTDDPDGRYVNFFQSTSYGLRGTDTETVKGLGTQLMRATLHDRFSAT